MSEKSSNIDRIIQELRSLDLCKYPHEEIVSLLTQIDRLPMLLTILHPGRLVIRGRVYNDGEDFTSIQSHSYNPFPKKEYQRANIPNQSMFYGAVTSDIAEEPLARITILTEVGNTLSDKVEKEKVMFSAWEVIDDISLFSIIQTKHYQTPNKLIKKLEERFNNEFVDMQALKFLDFIASEFAKSDTAEDYNYMISAIFSACVCNDEKFDGIYYPSVRTTGAGMNVAILPEAVDAKMRFLRAVDCDVIRKGLDIKVTENRKSIFKLEYIPIINADYK